LPAEGRLRGPLLACLLTALAFTLHLSTFRNPLGRYDRTRLPGFDAYVYVAMAEHPAIFTLPPWGYRILTPWVVRGLSRDLVEGFRRLAILGLGTTALLFFAFLRRLGVREWAALAGVGLFVFSPPVAEALHYRFLSEPLCVLLEIALLLLLAARPDIGFVAVIAVLGAFAKEEFLLFLPVVYLARREGGLGRAVLACLPAGIAFFVLRWFWAVPPPLPAHPLSLATFWLGIYRILAQWRDWWSTPLFGGLLVANGWAVATRAGRAFLARYGFVELVAIGVAFAASVYTDDAQTVPFFAADVPRLLIYAVPLAIAAAGVAFEGRCDEAPGPRLTMGFRGLLAAVFLAVLPIVVQDPYRRADLRGPRDGRMVLAVCRDSLAFAERLEKGKALGFDVENRTFPSVGGDPQFLDRMRWFLRDGWGPRPQYGTGPAVMSGDHATLLLPCLRPAAWSIALFASAPGPTTLALRLNGHPLGQFSLDDSPKPTKVPLDPTWLFRGDNELEFDAPSGAGVRLHDLIVKPRASSPD
jgi:hypothetical protein